MILPQRHEFWEQETARLFHRMEEEGVKVRVLNRQDGYEKWWERVAFSVARVFNKKVETGLAAVLYDGKEARVYLPLGSEADHQSLSFHALMRHECVHVLQARRIARGRLGAFLFALGYLLCLPAVWTLRARWETEAYLESARTWILAGAGSRHLEWLCDRWALLFRSSAYLFMDPKGAGGFAPDGKYRTLVIDKRLRPESTLNEIGFFPRHPADAIRPDPIPQEI